MGSIKRFNLKKIINEYHTEFFFETGTWRGDGIAYAAQFPFKKLYSSEIIHEIADNAKERFKSQKNIEIIEGNSTDVLNNKLAELKGNCLFWLDAHFPGAEEGLTHYNTFENEKVKLPLEEEIYQLASIRKEFSDVIIIDDLRIYEVGPYTYGNLPEGILPPKLRNIDFVYKAFKDSYIIKKSYKDEGYLIVLPAKKKETNKFRSLIYKISNTINKKIY
jgi:hypothetical protein